MHFENTSKNSKNLKNSQNMENFEKTIRAKSLKFIFTYPYQVSKTSNRKQNVSPVIKNLP